MSLKRSPEEDAKLALLVKAWTGSGELGAAALEANVHAIERVVEHLEDALRTYSRDSANPQNLNG